ncbi:lactate utilization protein C [Streptomyces sp. NPDC059578]|uniref:LutC/YkgG family protein n=1 Tax=Streptomyces sp. NPDC059578 TaxID=3346874 RepID=UPI00368003BE
MNSRERVLGRVRRALADDRGEGPAAPTSASRLPRDYLRTHGERSERERTALLAEHLTEYRAHVHRADPDGLPELIARLLDARGARRVLVPAGLPPHWLSAAVQEPVPDRAEDTAAALDGVDSVLTGCALAIAETGTLVLDGGPDQGRRRITLVPDHHICVVRVPDQVVCSVPQAVARLDPTRPQTWISGPSATSDIELDRVEGVHGPRTLDVVLVGSDGPGRACAGDGGPG